MEEKQKLLRQQIIDKGYDPSKFYEYWESLALDFQTVDFADLRIIVETYIKTYLEHTNQEHEEDQDFNDFQDPSTENHASQVDLENKTKDVYADFNWDLLMGKGPEQTANKSPTKKELKKLPKTFEKKAQEVEKPKKIIKTIKRNSQEIVNKKPQKSMEKSIDLINDDDFEQSLVYAQKKTVSVQDTSQVEKNITITFKEIQSQSKREKINCLKLKENILQHHRNVEIFISNIEEFQQESSSIINKLWKGNQFIYSVKTIGRNKNRSIGVSWETKRRYSDFEWLRNTLLKFYPGLIVPPLPPFPKNKDKLEGQKKKLQNFLMDAYRCPELRNSKYYQVFLSYGNSSDFQAFKKTTQTAPKPKELHNILNMTGEINMLHGVNIQIFSTGIQKYLSKSSQHLKNVKNILAEITGHYDSISNCYTRLADVFELMSRESCQFSSQKCFPKLTETYKQIASLIEKHSTFCIQEKSNIQTFLISHFSYQKDRIDNMQSLITKKNQFTSELGRRQPKQQGGGMFGKLTGLFGQKVESIQIPSSKYQTLYKQVGYYNSQLLNQMVRCVEVMIESQIDHFSGYGINRIDSVDSLQKTWSEIMVELSKLNIQ